MGLDMFLYGVKYLSKYEKNNDGQQIRDKTKIIKTEEIYWRKANHIHEWFVQNIQRGYDECIPHEVTKEQLLELKNLCNEVIEFNDMAEELLPTQEGFFFGSTDYGEWYFEETERTINEITRVLEEDEYDWYEYCSSW